MSIAKPLNAAPPLPRAAEKRYDDGMADALTQRVAVVTGGAKRVGRAIVERLIADGYRVIFTYARSAREGASLAAATGATAVQADLADPGAATRQLVKAVGPRLDVLVNNASSYEPSGLQQVTLEQLRRLQAVNVEAPLMLCQAFAPLLRASRGHVVNMIDLLAERPFPKYLGYCSTKAALANLTLGLARELAPDVTVNGIAPGVVDWPDDMPLDDRERYLSRVPLGRAGTPADVAALVAYLVGEGSYVTGQIIRLDGGRSLA